MKQSNFDFSKPQRQSLIGVVVLFVNTLQKSIRALWPIILVYLFRNKTTTSLLEIYLGIFGIVFCIALIAFLRYWFFQFYIDYSKNEFVIESGIFNKTKTTIPFHKIQKVTIDQSLIQRIFKVYKLELDTAGSDKKEASIKAISEEMALELKSSLVQNKPKKAFVEDNQYQEIDSPKSFISISIASLLKIGITANYLTSFAYLILVFSTISENLKQIGREDVIENNMSQLEKLPISSLFFGFLFFIITAVLLINLVLTVVNFFNFNIRKDGKSFVLNYGLLNIKSTIISPEKVQIVKWTQNFFQKKLNVNTIEIFQASSEMKRASAKDKTKIPGCNLNEKEQIITLLLDKMPSFDKVLYPNIRKLIIRMFFFVLLPVTIGLVINGIAHRFSQNAMIMITVLYVFLMGVILLFSYKNYRLFVSDDFIMKQSGAWDIDHEIIESYKIQAVKTHQFFWQKWTDIGSVVVYTAGGRISFSTTNYTAIKKEVNVWLYQVETSKRNWM